MKKKLSVLLLSENTGKFITFRVNYGFTKICTFCAVFSLCLFIFGVSSFTTEYLSHDKLKTMVASLHEQRELRSLEKREFMSYRGWAQNLIMRKLNFEELTGKGTGFPAENILDGEINYRDFDAKQALLDIAEFSISRINLSLDFTCSFKLVSRLKGSQKLTGYLFIIASNKEVIPQITRSWPLTSVSDGRPIDFTQGSSFNLRFMKKVQGRIDQPDIGPKYNQVAIVAFSESGEMLMKKGFYIEKLLQESPFE